MATDTSPWPFRDAGFAIKSARRALIKVWHPDRAETVLRKQLCDRRCAEINVAFDDAVARAKSDVWLAWKRKHGAAGAIRLADELRAQVAAQRPGWPRDNDRLEDIMCHVRVAEALTDPDQRRNCQRLRQAVPADLLVDRLHRVAEGL